MLKLTDNNLVAHQSGKKKKNLPCLKRKDIFSFVLVRKQKMELTVTSGFINNPPASSTILLSLMFVNLEIKNYHHGTSYATRHTCVTRTVTLDGLRHLLWLLLM